MDKKKAQGERDWFGRIALIFITMVVLGTIGGLQLFVGLDAQGQEIPRDEYLRYIPLKYPTIVRQTNANDKLHLFGDMNNPEYRDMDPVDGISVYQGTWWIFL